jgi:hypothetical protein
MLNRSLNDDLIRLTQIDSALLYVQKNAGALGLGSNACRDSLMAERDQVIAKIRANGEQLMDEAAERHAAEGRENRRTQTRAAQLNA